MVLQPDRILLDRAIVVELEMIVIVIGDALVLVGEVFAERMVGERMSAAVGLVFFVLGVRHQALSSNTLVGPSPALAFAPRADRRSFGMPNDRKWSQNGAERVTSGRRPRAA